ncbi:MULTISPECIES: hypothetical protein [unclassified Bifidobacterium]|nr:MULTISPECIES: hypothetical protein [unclassified Bifidobacterium]
MQRVRRPCADRVEAGQIGRSQVEQILGQDVLGGGPVLAEDYKTRLAV